MLNILLLEFPILLDQGRYFLFVCLFLSFLNRAKLQLHHLLLSPSLLPKHLLQPLHVGINPLTGDTAVEVLGNVFLDALPALWIAVGALLDIRRLSMIMDS